MNVSEVVFVLCRVLAQRSVTDYWKELIATINKPLRDLQDYSVIPLHRNKIWKLVVQESTRLESLLAISFPTASFCMLRDTRFNAQLAAIFDVLSDAQVASLMDNWTRVEDKVRENDTREMSATQIKWTCNLQRCFFVGMKAWSEK